MSGTPSDLPASPPDELLEELAAAYDRVEALSDSGLELHFDTESGRLEIELRLTDGTPLRAVRPSEALDIATGLGPL